ncbi:MAG: aminoglycoside phosphotransferase family protein [Devosia sp.]|uniref:aminoglycoside phosphotransferase family protein n=1 Tax=Devosia sp. TaxID=1871048 RepID=UPI001A58DA35|nr:aminoglycoside phosphotransferase family protein [Devosia sp.]MBL8597736.1 aminoglycoside phosphotransferase family protein [Devosia sp.]
MTNREAKLRSGKFPVDAALVEQLVARQFPLWAGLPVRPVATDGWDNWTFHLGDSMKVRLPSAEGYAEQAAKESHWLPRLAPHLPAEVPVPLAIGQPDEGFPWLWSVCQWIDGEPVTRGIDKLALARDVASFLNALQAIDAAGGPAPGQHSFLRGAHPMGAYGAEARRFVDALAGAIDTQAAHAVLDAAAGAGANAAVWAHGDVAVGNLLARNGRLSAVLDFGCAAVGDPSCDLVLAWVFLEGESRAAFRALVAVDEATWARGRAWALWKAALLAASGQITHPAENAPLEVIAAVIADHRERA